MEAESKWRELASQDADGVLTPYQHDAMIAAEENAGMTGDEQGYADYSPKWYQVFHGSYELMLDIEPEETS